jgi:hypothetical protein
MLPHLSVEAARALQKRCYLPPEFPGKGWWEKKIFLRDVRTRGFAEPESAKTQAKRGDHPDHRAPACEPIGQPFGTEREGAGWEHSKPLDQRRSVEGSGTRLESLSVNRHTHLVWTHSLGQLIAAAEQTTARGHPGRACGNSVHPKTRPVGFQGLIPCPSDVSRTHPHP